MAVYGRMELTMEKIIVDGGYPLSGKVDVSGMKNAAVASAAVIKYFILCSFSDRHIPRAAVPFSAASLFRDAAEFDEL